MPTYLDTIIERRRAGLRAQMQLVPLAQMQARAAAAPAPLDFAASLRRPGIQVIAEFKKASPSRGPIAPNADPVAVARSYTHNAAAAISVLTEEQHFMGRLEYLGQIKDALGNACPPLLRKDFILDPYQVYESRAARADALLLIVACLTDAELSDLLALAHSLSLACLVEVHDIPEAQRALATGAHIIGINNRDLRTFETHLETTQRVRPAIPRDRIVVSESGIKTPADVARLAAWNVNAFLIGEALMTAPDPGLLLRELLQRHD